MNIGRDRLHTGNSRDDPAGDRVLHGRGGHAVRAKRGQPKQDESCERNDEKLLDVDS